MHACARPSRRCPDIGGSDTETASQGEDGCPCCQNKIRSPAFLSPSRRTLQAINFVILSLDDRDLLRSYRHPGFPKRFVSQSAFPCSLFPPPLSRAALVIPHSRPNRCGVCHPSLLSVHPSTNFKEPPSSPVLLIAVYTCTCE